MKFLTALILLPTISGFMHQTPVSRPVKPIFGAGKYDGQLWDMEAKMDIWNMWDPNSPRSETNFNPFERNNDGNACDPSGWFPGDTKYKDPMRPSMDYAGMLAEKEKMAWLEENKKPGDVPGCPGCLN
eukprot:CAMPEP_0197291358 /NCGR_PEP_ID=MMETSP0890-20130614/13994_1 /TAXON_ID=44058 ORGANISM="Aureoumbra lagunensis, Strain CCMP1510" /NCGR_SAMPLE_ID=MMETSP0890 /ASSEMBLY_ACC=CAM_ASM_000533 /LENGTH=127 /DNA_ID=CAMNT_0042764223 /DNA_START=40 /DNA_END=423 /DNA_ORIENTATION=+